MVQCNSLKEDCNVNDAQYGLCCQILFNRLQSLLPNLKDSSYIVSLTRLGPQICSIQNCHIIVIVSVYIFCISLKYLEILSADTDSLLFFTNQQWLSLRWYQIFTSCCCGLSIWRKIQQLCKCMFLIACFFSLHFRGKKWYTHLYPFR